MPLYQRVAYMATELEVLAHSRYADHLRRRRPDLLDGAYDPGFARHGVRYDDERIGEIAAWCRVWTEGMFTPVYEARMSARAAESATSVVEATELIRRYRFATFTLMAGLTTTLIPETEAALPAPLASAIADPSLALRELAETVLPPGAIANFDLVLRDQRRNA
jgi:hypothetical protein